MRVSHVLMIVPLLFSSFQAAAEPECENADALRTSRILTVDPREYPLVGKMQYMETLPLRDREVVLTFDDGPLDEKTEVILEQLKQQCAKATFFMIGLNAAESPELARRVYDAGHTVGFHTFNHPDVEKMTFEAAKADINKGIAAVTEALGPTRSAAPFYRPPYLSMTRPLERYLTANGYMVWSIDADSEDWVAGTDDALLQRTIDRLEEAGKGILLMHDIQPATIRVLPQLLAELKKRNFKLVHVVPPADRTNKAADGVMSMALHGSWSEAADRILSLVVNRVNQMWEILTKVSTVRT